jgi:hypothetical protein
LFIFWFGNCIVCSFVIYGFWLPLWYLRFTASDYPFGILDFTASDYPFGILDLRILITGTPLVSSNFSCWLMDDLFWFVDLESCTYVHVCVIFASEVGNYSMNSILHFTQRRECASYQSAKSVWKRFIFKDCLFEPLYHFLFSSH